MRKIIVEAEISLDGIIDGGGPNFWEQVFKYHSDDVTEYLNDLLFVPDALLMGRLTYGAAIAHTGDRIDENFDVFPAARVRLDAYRLASARIAYRVTDWLEAHVRVANAFDADYQDVFGYRTEGRSVFGGLRVAFGR